LIHNTAGAFDAESVAELYEALGANGKIIVDAAQNSDQEVLDWLAVP